MRKIILKCSLILSFLFIFITGAQAEEKQPGSMGVDDIKKALGLSMYLQGGYTYNFENPDSQENGLRVFDHKANSFTLDLAQIVFTRDAPVGGIGYRLKLSAGETPKFIHAAGLGNNDNPFDLTEAYIDYVAPLEKGLKFRFGKFITMHGAEVIEAKDDMNYSRGLLFNFAVPFTHTGLMIGCPFSDKVGANFYVVNGWDNFDDEGSSKTLGLSVSLTPIEQFSAVINLMNGREQDLQTGVRSNRFLSDTVITVKPVKNLTLVVNTDYAIQSRSAPDGGDARWYGVAGYVKYDFTDLFSMAVRAEYFKDASGDRIIPIMQSVTGTPPMRIGTPVTAKEITITPEFRVAKDLIVRPEYRHDWSNNCVFDSRHKTLDKKSQDTIALGVMYTW
jgi:Putative beta-barrel porin-2, OmpL-like. bbp2